MSHVIYLLSHDQIDLSQLLFFSGMKIIGIVRGKRMDTTILRRDACWSYYRIKRMRYLRIYCVNHLENNINSNDFLNRSYIIIVLKKTVILAGKIILKSILCYA